MSALLDITQTLSVTDAASKGVPGLVREAEHGEDVIVSRHGTPVAAIVGIRHLQGLRALESDLRDLALVMTRAATDTGNRSDLDEIIGAFGYRRAELEAELDAELDAESGAADQQP